MKQFVIAATLALAAILPAGAQDKPEPKDQFTVAEALNITAGLGKLSSYETADKDGKPGKGYYEFSADQRIVQALNLTLGRNLQTTFERLVNDIKAKFSNGTGVVAEDRRGEYVVEIQKVMDAPSRVRFYRIKFADLCLKAQGDCKVANPIPADVLSLIWPILDEVPMPK